MHKNLFLILTSSFLTLNAASFTLNEKSIFQENTKKKEIKIKTLVKELLKKKNPSYLSNRLTLKYYKYHNFEPFFIKKAEIKPEAYKLLEYIKADEILKPRLDELLKIKELENQIEKIKQDNYSKPIELVKLDFMLISSYHYYMRYLSKGIIDWKKFQEKLKSFEEEKEIIANWQKYEVYKSIRKLLYEAIEKEDITYAIKQVNFTYPKAKQLSKLIKDYEQIAQNGGFIKIPPFEKSLKEGNSYPQIKFLRKRLLQSKDLEIDKCISETKFSFKNIFTNENIIKQKSENCEDLFDQDLVKAVKKFQKRHGLIADGIVGKNTKRNLNFPIEEKITKIRINLERMRWLPRNLGEDYILINIPDYTLNLYKNGEKELHMAVVIGEKKHPTPIFSHKVSKIVLNPYWRIPQRIVKREIIPKLVEDPLYLEKNEIATFENWDHESMKYDTSSVDWSMYLNNDLIGNAKEAPMRFIQIPGNKNPLGKMKFLFPNQYSVYMHDTPEKALFKNYKRAYSHGCIRLEKPQELLENIIKEQKNLKYEEAKQTLVNLEKKDLKLDKKIPVHIVYLTSWVEDDGSLQFRDDVYDYDKIQKEIIYNKKIEKISSY